MEPLLSIVIPTRDRPALLPAAIESALGQTLEGLEVVVVDNGSRPPVTVPSDPRVRVVHCPAGGTAAARNAGLWASRGRWITCLDDDDLLLPGMAEAALGALEASGLPSPVGLVSGIDVVDTKRRRLERRLPPTCPRGAHFVLEPLEPGFSYSTKQTLVVERSVLLDIGGWDGSFLSLVNQELFLRLNPVCSLLGLPEVTYQHVQHDGYRLSGDSELLQESFGRLERKHHDLLSAHPLGYAELLLAQARKLARLGNPGAAAAAKTRADELQARIRSSSERRWIGSRECPPVLTQLAAPSSASLLGAEELVPRTLQGGTLEADA